MKHLTILILLILFGQTQITYSEDIDIIRKSLYVQTYTRHSGALYPGNIFSTQLIRFQSNSFKDWLGYKGGDKISEPKFFKIAGLKHESKIAQTRINDRTMGAVFMFLGLTTSLLSIPVHSETPDADTDIILLLSGIGIEFLGLVIFLDNLGNQYPLVYAEKVAENYNKSLRKN